MSSTLGASLLRTVLSDGTLKILGSGLDKGPIINVPELYYLLQPMYNDSLHLGGDNNTVARKMKSCYLKTNNLHVRRMVQMLFE